MKEKMTVNGKEYEIIKLPDKGKGGYSYLAADNSGKYVLKQIHHEPCDHYQFGNKIESERSDYKKLREIGIRIPAYCEEPTKPYFISFPSSRNSANSSRSDCCTLMFAVRGSPPGAVTVISTIVPASIGFEKIFFIKAINFGWLFSNCVFALINFKMDAGFMYSAPSSIPIRALRKLFRNYP